MNRKNLIISVLVGLLIGAGLTYVAIPKPVECDHSAIEAQINNLEAQKINLKNNLEERSSELEKANNNYVLLQAQSESEKSQLESQIDYLQIELDEFVCPSPEKIFIETSFSQVEDTSSRLQYWIDRANSTIKIMVQLITQNDLADCLIEAHERGVDIDIVIDNQYETSTGSDFLELHEAGIDIRHDKRSALMHHKIMLIDGHVVIIGSYNWSDSAEHNNDENIIVLNSQEIYSDYLSEFNRIRAKCDREVSVVVEPEPEPESKPEPEPTVTYVASKNSEVFHRSGCYYVDRIKPSNMIFFYSRESAINSGRRPCLSCKP